MGSAGFLPRLALGALSSRVVLRGRQMAGLRDRHRVEDPVDLPVAEQIQPVPDRFTVALTGGDGDRGGPAPPSERALGLESRRSATAATSSPADTSPIPNSSVSVEPQALRRGGIRFSSSAI
jgi:hypothetical protein